MAIKRTKTSGHRLHKDTSQRAISSLDPNAFSLFDGWMDRQLAQLERRWDHVPLDELPPPPIRDSEREWI